MAGIAFFVYYMLVPLIQVNQELGDDRVLEERFFGWGSSQTITVELQTIQGDLDDNADIKRVEHNLQSCTQGLVDLMYPDYYRLRIAIDDESFEDGLCSMAVSAHYASVFEDLDCDIPDNTLATWSGWKNRSMPDVTEIKDSCKVVNSFEGRIIVEPAE